MLQKTYVLKYQLSLLSGLHIGGGDDVFDIGGADSTVIKNPISGQPYIPGSSIKGKIRALLTYKDGQIRGDQFEITNPTVRSLFEPVEKDDSDSIQVTRAIFRDAVLTEESAATLQKFLGTGVFTEVKAENSINPLSGKAANPRFIERIPAGAEFTGEVVLQIFEGDDEEAMKKTILDGFQMLENNYLGGSGTRGYGRVQFHDITDGGENE